MKEIDDLFKEMDKVFEQADNVFKKMEKVMEDVQTDSPRDPRGPWKAWFAWRPVKIKGKQIWMKRVYRRSTNTYVNHDDWTRYEYGDMFDVLKDAK